MRNPVSWFRALLVNWLAMDATPPADRAEVAKAGDTHSRRVTVAEWVDGLMERRRWNADSYAAEMFQRGHMASAADGIIGSMMSDGKTRIVEEVES